MRAIKRNRAGIHVHERATMFNSDIVTYILDINIIQSKLCSHIMQLTPNIMALTSAPSKLLVNKENRDLLVTNGVHTGVCW